MGSAEKTDTIDDQCPAGSWKSKTSVSRDRDSVGCGCQSRSIIKHGVRADWGQTPDTGLHRATQKKASHVGRVECGRKVISAWCWHEYKA